MKASSAGEGKGSTFEIRLPRIKAPTITIEVSESAMLPSRRVLVVHDNVDAAETLVALLDTRGHTTMAVYNARDALCSADTFKPEVMLIDIGLPEINGHELARQLRNRPSSSDVRMIAVTGYGQPKDRLRALDAGFDEHLVQAS